MDKKILDKIKKCLRLAKSSNANEAATALRQAQLLMEKHGVSTDDVTLCDVGFHTASSGNGKTTPMHMAILIDMVCMAFGTKAVVEHRLDFYGAWKRHVKFIGVGSAAEVSGYAFEVLYRQLNRDRNAYLKTLNKRLIRATKVRRADIYCQAWVTAVSRQVTRHSNTEQEDKAIELFKKQSYKKLDETKPLDRSKKMRRNDDQAYWDGRRDGNKVQFHQGVSGSKQKAIQ